MAHPYDAQSVETEPLIKPRSRLLLRSFTIRESAAENDNKCLLDWYAEYKPALIEEFLAYRELETPSPAFSTPILTWRRRRLAAS